MNSYRICFLKRVMCVCGCVGAGGAQNLGQGGAVQTPVWLLKASPSTFLTSLLHLTLQFFQYVPPDFFSKREPHCPARQIQRLLSTPVLGTELIASSRAPVVLIWERTGCGEVKTPDTARTRGSGSSLLRPLRRPGQDGTRSHTRPQPLATRCHHMASTRQPGVGNGSPQSPCTHKVLCAPKSSFTLSMCTALMAQLRASPLLSCEHPSTPSQLRSPHLLPPPRSLRDHTTLARTCGLSLLCMVPSSPCQHLAPCGYSQL